MGNENYVTIGIPRSLADEIDELIKSGKGGFRSRSEIAKQAIRSLLQAYKERAD